MIRLVRKNNSNKQIVSIQPEISTVFDTIFPLRHREEILLTSIECLGYAATEHMEAERIARERKFNTELFSSCYEHLSRVLEKSARYEFFNPNADDNSGGFSLTVLTPEEESLTMHWEIKDFLIHSAKPVKSLSFKFSLTPGGKVIPIAGSTRMLRENEVINLILQGLLGYVDKNLEFLLHP